MWASLFRSLDAAICINIIFMECFYLPALIGRNHLPRESFARNLILAIVIGWAAVLTFFGNLTFKYWLGLADPTESIADTRVRLLYLIIALVGTSMHIATAKRGDFGMGWWTLLSVWLTGVVCVVSGLMVVDLKLLPMVLDWPLSPPSPVSLIGPEACVFFP